MEKESCTSDQGSNGRMDRTVEVGPALPEGTLDKILEGCGGTC